MKPPQKSKPAPKPAQKPKAPPLAVMAMNPKKGK